MELLKAEGRLGRDARKIAGASKYVRDRLGSQDGRIREMTCEELQDMDEILQMASHILARHEDKRKVHSIMAEFVLMMEKSAGSIAQLDDHIQEMVLSAGGAVRGIREVQSRISDGLTAESVSRREAHWRGSEVE